MTDASENQGGAEAQSASAAEALPAPVEKFILHWGDMGNHWGLNRSIAQIHALLYLSDRPLTADRIAAQLGIARSGVSNSLRELVNWKLIRRVPVRGDRRDHFEAETDLWEVVQRIAEGRKAREIDPARAALKECVAAAEADPNVDGTAMTRLADMMAFIETMNSWYEQMLTLPKTSWVALISLGSQVVRALRPGGGGRAGGSGGRAGGSEGRMEQGASPGP